MFLNLHWDGLVQKVSCYLRIDLYSAMMNWYSNVGVTDRGSKILVHVMRRCLARFLSGYRYN